VIEPHARKLVVAGLRMAVPGARTRLLIAA
jgi:hypothetical protein